MVELSSWMLIFFYMKFQSQSKGWVDPILSNRQEHSQYLPQWQRPVMQSLLKILDQEREKTPQSHPEWVQRGIKDTLFISHKPQQNGNDRVTVWLHNRRIAFQQSECVYKNTQAFNECTREDNGHSTLTHIWMIETIHGFGKLTHELFFRNHSFWLSMR